MDKQDLSTLTQGIAIAEGTYGPTIYISDHDGEVASWTFEEVATDPDEWYKCLSLVIIATKLGPAAARKHINDAKRNDPSAVETGALMCCNVCGSEFRVGNHTYHRVTGKFNGREICDYQCSEECNQERIKEMMLGGCGEHFLQELAKRMVTRRTNKDLPKPPL